MKLQNEKTPANLVMLMTIGLAASLALVYVEVMGAWSTEQVMERLLTPIGIITIALYVFLGLFNLSVLIFNDWLQARVRPLVMKFQSKRVIRWLVIVAPVLFMIWVYLFSPWQMMLRGPWTQFVFAAGVSYSIGWVLNPHRSPSLNLSDLGLTFVLFLYPRIVQEIRIIVPTELASRSVISAGFILVLFLIFPPYEDFGQGFLAKIVDWRKRLGWARQVLIVAFLFTPFLISYLFGESFYILYPNIRFALVMSSLWVIAYLFCLEPNKVVSLEMIGLSLSGLILTSSVNQLLLLVVDYPFSLSWSEGNRLYDYSLVFGQSLYQHVGGISDPYGSPGRYALWGVLHLWPGLPIWAHRLWNVFLLTAPALILAWLLTRKIRSFGLRAGLFFWIATFFIALTPLHPPFMIMTIIVSAFMFHPSPVVRAASLIMASLYAGISRWTWVLVPGIWGMLGELFLYYPKRHGNWIQRLLPAALMAVLGALPGLLLNINNFVGYSTGQLTTANQPLLWYRLLPNPTLGPGIILLVLVITGPIIAMFIYKMSTRQWQVDIFQGLAVWGSLLGLLGAGLVISTKIGGGGDLHNLDMYLATLMILTVLGFVTEIRMLEIKRWPAWVLGMVLYLALLPAYPLTPFSPPGTYNARLDIPSEETTEKVLDEIRVSVADASRRGEVLFMDQRQLVTFGYINAINFVSEYEKKYMMDQALASNEIYFEPYYRDLARKRFSLIITEPLKVVIKGGQGGFSEENDLWVAWVSEPTLCFYEPIFTDKSVGVQLLVPRENAAGCEKYLQ